MNGFLSSYDVCAIVKVKEDLCCGVVSFLQVVGHES